MGMTEKVVPADAAAYRETRALIGQCWAGGELTGEALRLLRLGEFAAAREVAERQIESQRRQEC